MDQKRCWDAWYLADKELSRKGVFPQSQTLDISRKKCLVISGQTFHIEKTHHEIVHGLQCFTTFARWHFGISGAPGSEMTPEQLEAIQKLLGKTWSAVIEISVSSSNHAPCVDSRNWSKTCVNLHGSNFMANWSNHLFLAEDPSSSKRLGTAEGRSRRWKHGCCAWIWHLLGAVVMEVGVCWEWCAWLRRLCPDVCFQKSCIYIYTYLFLLGWESRWILFIYFYLSFLDSRYKDLGELFCHLPFLRVCSISGVLCRFCLKYTTLKFHPRSHQYHRGYVEISHSLNSKLHYFLMYSQKLGFLCFFWWPNPHCQVQQSGGKSDGT